jgi:hypothetical protein
MFKGASVGPQLAGPGRYIVSSTRGADLANDAATATGTSLFTEHFVAGMLGAATDGNGDGYIDLREIYDYVRDRLLTTTKQVPHCRFDGDAAVSLARVRAAPAIARVPPAGHARSREPTFALAENTITLRDVEPDEQLAPELVEVIQLADRPLDLVARTDDDWLQATVSTDGVIVMLRPRPGRNRGKVTVRDRNSSSAQVLRVEAHVRLGTAAVAATKGASPDVALPRAEPTPEPQPQPAPVPQPQSAPVPQPQSAPVPQPQPTPVPQHAVPQVPQPPLYQPQEQWSPPGQPAWSASTQHLAGPASAGRPAFGRSASWFGVGVAALGGLLLVIAFSGVGWYKINGDTGSAGDLSTLASSVHAGLADAYFGGLDWLLIVAIVGCGAVACLQSGGAARILARLGLFLGVVSIGLMMGALAQLWIKAEHNGLSDVGVFKHTASGFWLALVGFVLAGIAGLFRRRQTRR